MKDKKKLWELTPEEIQNYYVRNSPRFEPPGIDIFGFVEGPLVKIKDINELLHKE